MFQCDTAFDFQTLLQNLGIPNRKNMLKLLRKQHDRIIGQQLWQNC